MVKRPELRPRRTHGYTDFLLTFSEDSWRYGISAYRDSTDARNAICVRMLERLPPMSNFIPPTHAVKTWKVWIDSAARFDGPTPLAALYQFWSAQ